MQFSGFLESWCNALAVDVCTSLFGDFKYLTKGATALFLPNNSLFLPHLQHWAIASVKYRLSCSSVFKETSLSNFFCCLFDLLFLLHERFRYSFLSVSSYDSIIHHMTVFEQLRTVTDSRKNSDSLAKSRSCNKDVRSAILTCIRWIILEKSSSWKSGYQLMFLICVCFQKKLILQNYLNYRVC